MKFIDEAKIYVQAGNGGNGCVSFRREKFVPKGGPDGGSGGNGGSIIVQAIAGKKSLLDFHYKKFYRAENGKHGRGKNIKGRDGKSLIIYVPCGTIIKNENNEIIADLVNPGDKIVVANGGMGGRGNFAFVTSTNQAPRNAEAGKKGERKTIYLELKLIADVGIIGLPNAGKSTLINKISSCKAKVAPYAFTTLSPNLGVVFLNEERTFTVADCPGIIDGSAQGKGLGFKFLRHIERCKILLHLIDISATSNPMLEFEKIENELMLYKKDVYSKKRIVVLNKIDLIKDKEKIKNFEREFINKNLPLFSISALQGDGIKELLEKLWKEIN